MKNTTLGEALRDARRRLDPRSTAPAADAVELLSRLVDVTRGELLARIAEPLDPELAARWDTWLDRRIAGEPVQYITGRAAFRSLDLVVTPAVLIPRPETEGLVEAVLEVLAVERGRWPSPRVLDLGTGSGAIALAVATEWPAASVIATDVSEAALELARRNAEAVSAAVTFRLGDWFGAVEPDERFEVVVSNPPYIATSEADALPDDVRRHEPEIALFSGDTGLDAIREIVEEAPRHLVAGGLLAMELAEDRAGEVAAWLDGAHDWQEVELRNDLSGRPRVLLARRERGPAIAPAQWREDG